MADDDETTNLLQSINESSEESAETRKKSHPTYTVMILKAIRTLGGDGHRKTPVSVPAISKFIKANYDLDTINTSHLKRTLKLHVQSGLLKKYKASYKMDPRRERAHKTTKKKASKARKNAATSSETQALDNIDHCHMSDGPDVNVNTGAAAAAAEHGAFHLQAGEELQNVFQQFFGELDEFRARQLAEDPWHSDEARQAAQREHWGHVPIRRSGTMQVTPTDADGLPTIDVDPRLQDTAVSSATVGSRMIPAPELNRKICIHRGTIYHLNVDVVVNATDHLMSGGGGLDAAMHTAASPEALRQEIQLIGHSLPVGFAQITRAYELPSKYIVHCAGPRNADALRLASCYQSALDLMARHGLRSIAFPSIATGALQFPVEAAAQLALQTTRRWLETGDNASKVDRIVFVAYRTQEETAYLRYVSSVFPCINESAVDEEAVRQNDEFLRPWLATDNTEKQ